MHIRHLVNLISFVLACSTAIAVGCGDYVAPTFDEPSQPPVVQQDAGNPSTTPPSGGSATTTAPSEAGPSGDSDAATPTTDAGSPVVDSGSAVIDAAPEASGPKVDSGGPVMDAGCDAADASDGSVDAADAGDGSGKFILTVFPGGGVHAFTVYMQGAGMPGEPSWGNPTYTQTATSFYQAVKAFPTSTFIVQGYWDPAFAGDWTHQMCHPDTLTLAVDVRGFFEGQALTQLTPTVVSNNQGGCNLQFVMPAM